jgi:hypothetical protein
MYLKARGTVRSRRQVEARFRMLAVLEATARDWWLWVVWMIPDWLGSKARWISLLDGLWAGKCWAGLSTA